MIEVKDRQTDVIALTPNGAICKNLHIDGTPAPSGTRTGPPLIFVNRAQKDLHP